MKPPVPDPHASKSSRRGGPLRNGAPSPDFDPPNIPYPDLDALITDDGAPVDNLFVEKQYRLLTEPLNTSWTPPGEEKRFLVATDVGIFHKDGRPPLAPDCFLSLGVSSDVDLQAKEHRSYFLWIIGKAPEVVIEIVSDKRGGEEDFKRDAYAEMGVLYYVIFDPLNRLRGGVLRAGALRRRKYKPIEPAWFDQVGVGLTLWHGVYETFPESWLRWCDRNGRVIPTGAELVAKANRKAAKAIQKAKRLAAQLRALGIDPDV
jgi:Uma2 family endonuclease